MAFKLVNITFVGGGDVNGEIIKNFPVYRLKPELIFRIQGDIYFANHPSGDMAIMKGKLNNLWHSYSVSVYQKNELTKASTGNIEYNYIGERDIERCAALTNKNVQCMKPAINGNPLCTTHNHVNKTKEVTHA
ncbi:MAG: hypothetical protein JKY69_07860 [Flavobacteriaceae bacterium]|nr:hypothetical protein [Flavobacteriaceae bacterium]MBL4569528.1 hypothetical protein [Flavobacteriaceae bacterium]